MATITLTNPFSGASVERDVSNITDQIIAGYALDPAITEEVNGDGIEYATPGDWLAAYVDRVGAERAGIQILGS